MENKPASLFVVSLGKVLNGMPHLHVVDKWWGQTVYPSCWPSLTKNRQTENEFIRVNESIFMKWRRRRVVLIVMSSLLKTS